MVLLLELLGVRSKHLLGLLLLTKTGVELLSSLGLLGRGGSSTGRRGGLVVLRERELECLTARVADVRRARGVHLAVYGLGGGLALCGLAVACWGSGELDREGDDGSHIVMMRI